MTLTDILTHPFIDRLREYEGLRLDSYICPAGKPTIGYGHVIRKYEHFDEPITEFQAECLLNQDIIKAVFNLERIAPELFDYDEYASSLNKVVAIVSFIFNIGESAFRSSTLLKRIHERNWKAATQEILRWDKATDPDTGKKVVLAGLTKRRKSEAALFYEGSVDG